MDELVAAGGGEDLALARVGLEPAQLHRRPGVVEAVPEPAEPTRQRVPLQAHIDVLCGDLHVEAPAPPIPLPDLPGNAWASPSGRGPA